MVIDDPTQQPGMTAAEIIDQLGWFAELGVTMSSVPIPPVKDVTGYPGLRPVGDRGNQTEGALAERAGWPEITNPRPGRSRGATGSTKVCRCAADVGLSSAHGRRGQAYRAGRTRPLTAQLCHRHNRAAHRCAGIGAWALSCPATVVLVDRGVEHLIGGASRRERQRGIQRHGRDCDSLLGGIGPAKKRASSPDQSGTSARAGAVGSTENAETNSTDIHVVRRRNRMAKVDRATGSACYMSMDVTVRCRITALRPRRRADDGLPARARIKTTRLPLGKSDELNEEVVDLSNRFHELIEVHGFRDVGIGV